MTEHSQTVIFSGRLQPTQGSCYPMALFLHHLLMRHTDCLVTKFGKMISRGKTMNTCSSSLRKGGSPTPNFSHPQSPFSWST